MEAKEFEVKLAEGLSDHKKSIGQLIDEKLQPGSKKMEEFQEAQKEFKKANDELSIKVDKLNEELVKVQADATAIRSKGEENKSWATAIADGFAENFKGIKEAYDRKSVYKFDVKVVGTETASNNLTGAVVNSYLLDPAVRGRQKTHYRDLARVISSATGLFSFYRQNTPVGEGSFTSQSTHGNAKSQLDYDLTKVDVTAEYLAGFVRIARQMSTDLPFLNSFVNNELVEDYLRAEDDYFYSLWLAATAATPASSVYAEKIIQATANILANDGDANGIVMTPANWATFLNTKPTDYGTPGGVTIDANGRIRVAGITTYVIPKRVFRGTDVTIVGDWSKTAIVQTEGLSVQMFEQDSDNVQKNLVTVRAEARVGQAIFRPEQFCAF